MSIIDKKNLQQQIINHLKDNKHILVESGPGIGRDTIMKEVLKESGHKFIELTSVAGVTIEEIAEHIKNMQKISAVDIFFVNDFDKNQISNIIEASKNVNIPVIISLANAEKCNCEITAFKNLYEIKKYFNKENTKKLQEKISNARHEPKRQLKNPII